MRQQKVGHNNSFKPNLLRYTNNVAGKACHVVASATQVGLTQALALMSKSVGDDQVQDMIQAWRFLVGGALMQILGGALGLWFGVGDSQFDSLTTGLAFGTPAGVAIGWMWHKASSAPPVANWIARLLVICSVLLPLSTLFP